jgi:arylsulfatase A-like enzyme
MYLIFEAFADAGYEPFYWCDHNMASPGLNYDQGLRTQNVFKSMLTAEHPEFAKILAKLEQDPSYRALIVTSFTVTHSNYNSRPLVDGFLEQYPDEIEDITYDEFKTYGQLFVQNAIELSLNFPEVIARNNLNEVDVFKLRRTVELMYKACVHELDRLFGNVVAEVRGHGLFDESLIAFTSDHGEMLYRKNALFPFGHGYELPHDVLSVAWLLHTGGTPVKPRVYEGVTRSIDVYPTLAGLCNIPLAPERRVAGVDLSRALRTGETLDLLGYSHTSLPNPYVLKASGESLFKQYFPELDPELAWVCIRDGDMFYKWRKLDSQNWGYEVIDVATDPDEEHNLYDPANPQHREFAQRLTDYKARLVNAYREMWLWEDASGRQPAREDAIRRLKSLGYIR